MTYFSQFPQIVYNGQTCTNITERIVINVLPDPRNSPTSYLPYTIKDGMRADLIANYYYNDSTLDWLIWIANGITDPYYDWYLDTDDFNNFIVEKYGSIQLAQQMIAMWRTNWSDNDIGIAVNYYDSLPSSLQKYYTPNFGHNKQIVSYSQKQVDWIVATNQLLSIQLDSVTSQFVNNEIIQIYDQYSNPTGSCQIVGYESNNTLIYVQHTQGNTGPGNTIVGSISNCQGIITSTTILDQPIPLSEGTFWQPVFFYDIENELNESHKNIYMIDAGQVLPVLNSVRTLLANTGS